MTPTPSEIQISVNGRPLKLPAGSLVTDLVAVLGVPERGIALALNGEVVPKSIWSATVLLAGAKVEVVTIAAGG